MLDRGSVKPYYTKNRTTIKFYNCFYKIKYQENGNTTNYLKLCQHSNRV